MTPLHGRHESVQVDRAVQFFQSWISQCDIDPIAMRKSSDNKRFDNHRKYVVIFDRFRFIADAVLEEYGNNDMFVFHITLPCDHRFLFQAKDLVPSSTINDWVQLDVKVFASAFAPAIAFAKGYLGGVVEAQLLYHKSMGRMDLRCRLVDEETTSGPKFRVHLSFEPGWPDGDENIEDVWHLAP